MRRKLKKKRTLSPDLRYGSVEVQRLINYVMRKGKKSVAQKVVYDAFDNIKTQTKENPVEVFEGAIRNISPSVEVRSRRVGGANYQVPREVRPERRLTLAFRWIIEAAKNKKGSPMNKRLADELIAANKNEGEAVKKKENTYRMAEANKAFAHFGW